MVDYRSETPLAPGQQEVDRHNARMLHIKPLAPRLSAQALTIAIDDDKRSAASGQSAQALLPALLFDSLTAKSAAEIGEAAGTGDYPKFDKSWDYWLAASNPNASKLSDHDICVVHPKHMIDDSGQKWFHTLEQLEIHRLFARDRNPELESIAARQGICNAFKRQVNAYGQLAAYKSARSKLVPKPVAQPKTDWRSGSVDSKAKPKRQHAPQQMAAPAPARPQAGRGNGGGPRPPATAPIAAVAILP
jgi:hypothetical protein